MATTYTIERADNYSGPYSVIASGLTSPNADVSGQMPGSSFYYRVRAINVGYVSVPSMPVLVAMLDVPAPSAVGSVDLTHITISWPATCASLYRVYQVEPLTGRHILKATTSALSFDDYGVSLNTTYTYVVTALTPDLRAETPFSNSASASVNTGGVFSMARAYVYQGIQVGVESTLGTLVPATKRLKNIQINQTPVVPKKAVRYAGSKVATDHQRSHEHTESKYDGAMDFNTLTYIFASMFGIVTPTAPGALSKKWTWNPSSVSPLTPLSLTVEQGSSRGAEKFGYGIFDSLDLKWGEETADISGSMFGTEQIRNVTMTPALPVVPPMAADPIGSRVSISTDGSAWTQTLKGIEGEIHFNGLWKPQFRVNDGVKSFVDYSETPPAFQVMLTMEEGSEADTFMARLYDDQEIFVRYQNTGALIDAAVTGGTPSPAVYYMLQIDMPCSVMKPDPKDIGDVYGNTFTLDVIDDQTFGLCKVTLINQLASL